MPVEDSTSSATSQIADESTLTLSGNTYSIKNSGVDTAQINDSAVTNAKIAAAAGIPDSKLATPVHSRNVNINIWTYSVVAGSCSNAIATDKFGNANASMSAQNDEIRFKVYLEAGTYTLYMISTQHTAQGIATIELDDTTWTTIDMYGATEQAHLFTAAGLTVASAGLKNLDIKQATKNASSSGYSHQLQALYIVRTGD